MLDPALCFFRKMKYMSVILIATMNCMMPIQCRIIQKIGYHLANTLSLMPCENQYLKHLVIMRCAGGNFLTNRNKTQFFVRYTGKYTWGYESYHFCLLVIWLRQVQNHPLLQYWSFLTVLRKLVYGIWRYKVLIKKYIWEDYQSLKYGYYTNTWMIQEIDT